MVLGPPSVAELGIVRGRRGLRVEHRPRGRPSDGAFFAEGTRIVPSEGEVRVDPERIRDEEAPVSNTRPRTRRGLLGVAPSSRRSRPRRNITILALATIETVLFLAYANFVSGRRRLRKMA